MFLSYARVDRERAEAIARLLAGSGVAIWIDQVDIPGGTSWSGEIARGIRSCVTFALLCSKASMASANVQRELHLALDNHRPILPLVLEPAEIPDAIAYGLQSSEIITQRCYAARHQYELGRLLARVGEYERSELVLRDFLRAALKFRINVRLSFAEGLLGLALIAGSRKQHARTARLYGAAMHNREGLRLPIYASEKPLHDTFAPSIHTGSLGPPARRRRGHDTGAGDRAGDAGRAGADRLTLR